MPNYAVTLDLHRGGKQDYADLIAATEEMDCCRPFEGLMLLSTPWSAEQVEAYLRTHLDPQDGITVDALAEGQGWSGWVHDIQVKMWLQRHLGASS